MTAIYGTSGLFFQKSASRLRDSLKMEKWVTDGIAHPLRPARTKSHFWTVFFDTFSTLEIEVPKKSERFA